ncbi:MAG: bacteriocin immunity protein [Bacteroidota bacterium]
MNLRTSLTPTASKERLEKVQAMIQQIEEVLSNPDKSIPLIEEFNNFTDKTYDEEYFHSYWSAISQEEFARDAAQPTPVKDPTITKSELVEVVSRIINGDEHTDFYLAVLNVNTPHPSVSDLIFWPEKEESTPEEIIETALGYKPTQH